MKHLSAVCFALCLSAPAAIAEGDVDEGFNLVEEGAKIILRSLFEEMSPTLEELQNDLSGLAEEMAPAMRDLQGLIGDMTLYHMPEVLPNGDIIIRRKSPLEVDPDAEVEI